MLFHLILLFSELHGQLLQIWFVEQDIKIRNKILIFLNLHFSRGRKEIWPNACLGLKLESDLSNFKHFS